VSNRAGWTAETRVLVGGRAAGEALVLAEPLSLWGGLETYSGRIVEPRHAQHGELVTGRVLLLPSGRGSSSSSSVLAEMLRLGTAPAAVVLREADPIVALGSLVAQLLDGRSCPVVVAPAAVYSRIATGDWLVVADHQLELVRAASSEGALT
jgi:uncharacterized protein